jgi:hypothetical protein
VVIAVDDTDDALQAVEWAAVNVLKGGAPLCPKRATQWPLPRREFSMRIPDCFSLYPHLHASFTLVVELATAPLFWACSAGRCRCHMLTSVQCRIQDSSSSTCENMPAATGPVSFGSQVTCCTCCTCCGTTARTRRTWASSAARGTPGPRPTTRRARCALP